MRGGRPRLSAAEARLVREAAAEFEPATPREPIARDLAARVVLHLRAFASEASDSTLAALGRLGRATMPSPAATLASCPEINTLALFVEERVKSLRDRNGWTLRLDQEQADIEACLGRVQTKLTARYLKILRA